MDNAVRVLMLAQFISEPSIIEEYRRHLQIRNPRQRTEEDGQLRFRARPEIGHRHVAYVNRRATARHDPQSALEFEGELSDRQAEHISLAAH